jgi:hypothetical protein
MDVTKRVKVTMTTKRTHWGFDGSGSISINSNAVGAELQSWVGFEKSQHANSVRAGGDEDEDAPAAWVNARMPNLLAE